jgi:hypothetical protein
MIFQLHESKTLRGRGEAHRCTSILATAFACAALLVASQCAAQSRFDRDIADHVSDPARYGLSATQQTSGALATPAEADVLTSVPAAPVPNLEEADLVSPASNPFLALAEEGGQSSSSQNLPSDGAPAKPPTAKTKSTHHGLGVALAVVGTAALVSGIALFATEQSIGFCSPSSHGCSEAKDAGLVLMPVGAGVAITGFYLQFHR